MPLGVKGNTGMQDDGQDTKILLLISLLALWFAAWGYSLSFFLSAVDAVDGSAQRENRVVGFLGWQGIAGIIAFACFAVGRSFAKGSGSRRISAVPLGMALMVVFLLIGAAVLGVPIDQS